MQKQRTTNPNRKSVKLVLRVKCQHSHLYQSIYENRAFIPVNIRKSGIYTSQYTKIGLSRLS